MRDWEAALVGLMMLVVGIAVGVDLGVAGLRMWPPCP